jgi:UDPglucose--hexose-1-phosphate uridylyltransferase
MNELRKDLVSGDWIIIAPGRAKRPSEFLPEKKERNSSAKEDCPFEDFEKSGNVPVILSVPDEKNWRAAIIPNKYPALAHSDSCAVVAKEGLFEHAEGLGQHDLLVFREHGKGLDAMSLEDVVIAFEALQKRYEMLSQDPCLEYTSAFFNWGASAGASLHHPHIQILTLPIMPPSISHSLLHSRAYWQNDERCVHCDILAYEQKEKKRIVYENEHAVAVAPYASRNPFGVTVYPKTHLPSFEASEKADLQAVIEVLQACLGKMRTNINDPDLNFFIHTSPLKNKGIYQHYHWHVEILPKISTPAGFELSTGVLINVVPPETAAEILRK